MYGQVDTSGWVCVGEVPYWPWGAGKKKLYVMVNPQKEQRYGKLINDIIYTENQDGSGKQIDSVPQYKKEQMIIYPEHQDDEFGEMFLGKRKETSTLENMHKEFISKLFKIGNKIILHHDSSYKMTDGVVRKGEPNGWSNNTDIGIYFWGSRNRGKDPSNVSLYTYYCMIDENQLYDFETNEERLTLRLALSKYDYVGQFWKDNESIVVNTFQITPIFCILEKDTGKWYDKDWKEIEKPF